MAKQLTLRITGARDERPPVLAIVMRHDVHYDGAQRPALNVRL